MSARNFRFKSPGIRIEEIDQSLIDAPVENEIGPVIIGRSPHGPSLKPVKVNSLDEFVNIFGTPSPGGIADTDQWRSDNKTSPHYGAYAAMAYLQNAAPITFIRLAGLEHPQATTDGQAGWKTTKTTPSTTLADNGGAYGLWLIPSASSGVHTASVDNDLSTGGGTLAAIIYSNSGSGVTLSSSLGTKNTTVHSYSGTRAESADIKLHLTHSAASGKNERTAQTVEVSLDPAKSNFIRKVLNTSPLLTNASLYSKPERYWLGETFETSVKELKASEGNIYAFIAPLGTGSASTKADYPRGFTAPKTGWILSQDTGLASSYDPIANPPQELFRLCGLSEGRWASKNLKISINNINYGKIDDDANPYGSFNIEVRLVGDSDRNPQILEKFEECNLNPRSPKYVGRVVGTQYLEWDNSDDKMRLFGEYPNNSRYIRVEEHPDLAAGKVDKSLIPFGFMGPARRKKIVFAHSSSVEAKTNYVDLNSAHFSTLANAFDSAGESFISASSANTPFTASVRWPDYQLRKTASNGATGRAQNTYFGIRTEGSDTSRYYSDAYADLTYPLGSDANGANSDSWEKSSTTEHTFAFSLDDLQQVYSSTKGWQDDAVWAQNTRKTVDSAAEKAQASIMLTGEVVSDYNGKTIEITDSDGTVLGLTGSNTLELYANSGTGLQRQFGLGLVDLNASISAFEARDSLLETLQTIEAQESTLDIKLSPELGKKGQILLAQGTAGSAGDKTISTTIASSAATITGFTGGADSSYRNSISARGAYFKSSGDFAVNEPLHENTVGWKVVLDAGYNKFTMPLHGGFDGTNLKEKNPFSNSNIASSVAGQDNYAHFSVLAALKMLKDPEFLEFDIAAVPGLHNASLNQKLAEYCEDRKDALAILDIDSGYRPSEEILDRLATSKSYRGSVGRAVDYRNTELGTVVHSYAACYYPWVKVFDPRTDSTVDVPPTVPMLGVFGNVAANSEPWFAPAGFARGGLSDGSAGIQVLSVKDRLNSSERDELYENGINPIANFPSEGIVVYGQKTLQLKKSALDRINVRRLMIFLKKEISSIASRTLFEQNVRKTWQGFTDEAEAVLATVQDGLGLVDFKFVLNEKTTTPDLIDQNILYAKLYVKPARSIEFIALDFILTSTGADFPE